MQRDHQPPPATERNDGAARAVRILVVDDSMDATEMLSLILEHKGYESERAHSGTDALTFYETFRPDVVLLDIGLPDLDGYTVATRMREINPGPMLVAVTGFGDDQTVAAVKRCGFSHHLLKPINWDALDEVLARVAQRAAQA